VTDAEPSALDVLAVPALRSWLEDVGASASDVWSYLQHGGTFANAVALLTLCSPAFVEARGCVLLAEHYGERTFENWWTTLRGDRRAVEQVVNHVHLWDVLPSTDDVPEAVVEQFAHRLAELWRGLLAQRYPARTFTVEVDTSPDEYGPTLTLFQEP
jgi:hypothetical protein